MNAISEYEAMELSEIRRASERHRRARAAAMLLEYRRQNDRFARFLRDQDARIR